MRKAVPFFDEREFKERLFRQFGNDHLCKRMIELHNKFQFCLGLIPDDEWRRFFKSKQEILEFQLKHKTVRMRHVYDANKMTEIISDELSLPDELARRFNDCEEEYLKSIGAM